MPIPGIVASQITGHLSTNSYESIQTVTVGSGGQASISFTSIPSTYKHLQIRGFLQSDRNNYPIENALMTFNGDTGSNYSAHYIYAGVTAGTQQIITGSTTSATNIILNDVAGATAGGQFGASVIDILDYANTNKYKTIKYLAGNDINNLVLNYSGQIAFGSGNWRNTNAITNISISVQSSTGFTQYSSFALYGIKG